MPARWIYGGGNDAELTTARVGGDDDGYAITSCGEHVRGGRDGIGDDFAGCVADAAGGE